MKTNSFARGIVKIRGIVLGLAIVGMVGVEFGLGESFAARFGQTTARQAAASQVPSLSIGDLMAAAPVGR